MNPSTDQRLADIVDLVPGAPRVLESFGLDYCCGGQQTLAAASEDRGIDAQAVIAALDSLDAGPAPDWVAMTPEALVDHLLSTHHPYLHDELPRIEALAEKVAGVHGERHPELVELYRMCTALRADLEPHMAKEEQILFPMVRELVAADVPPSFHCGSVANPVSAMMREHEHTGALLESMNELTDGYTVPEDACASYRALFEGLVALEADTHLHVHKENNSLFPAVVALEKRWALSG